MFKELTDDQLIAKLKESRPEVYANLQESAAGASQPKLVAIAKTAITASISESIKTSDLPQASKDKLTEELSEAVSVEDFISATDSSAFIGGIVTGAIQKERAYIAKLNESNVITGMGGNTDNTKLTGEQSMSQAFGRKEEKK